MGSEGGQGERGVLFLKRSTLCTLEVVRLPSFRLNSRVEFLPKEKCGFPRNTVTK